MKDERKIQARSELEKLLRLSNRRERWQEKAESVNARLREACLDLRERLDGVFGARDIIVARTYTCRDAEGKAVETEVTYRVTPTDMLRHRWGSYILTGGSREVPPLSKASMQLLLAGKILEIECDDIIEGHDTHVRFVIEMERGKKESEGGDGDDE